MTENTGDPLVGLTVGGTAPRGSPPYNMKDEESKANRVKPSTRLPRGRVGVSVDRDRGVRPDLVPRGSKIDCLPSRTPSVRAS
ncbi:hypothetical protein EVAR_86139_1 [Eumeta japonica]|uniref:Uncharacterized protein n=1 Tax=Eumeta variegata TaxID=151549 RepID=A0A4C1V1V9_EUMVA|nr:hypothetical protein EVAR_86139_1 [Eumeta japonica]